MSQQRANKDGHPRSCHWRSIATSDSGSRARLDGRIVGMFFLWTSGIHAGIVAADPQFYRHFADTSYLGFVRDGWTDIVMAHPAIWGLLLTAGEAALGALLLVGGRPAKLGWIGVVSFHVLLMLFGFGFWLWAVPALTVLIPLLGRDWPGLSKPTSRRAVATGSAAGEGGGADAGRQRAGGSDGWSEHLPQGAIGDGAPGCGSHVFTGPMPTDSGMGFRDQRTPDAPTLDSTVGGGLGIC